MKLKNISEFRMVNEAQSTMKLSVPSDVREMNKLFKKAGYQLYIVGGAVRDALLGNIPKDYDLATDAKPEQVKAILSGTYKFIEIGEAFNIVMAIAPDGEEYEIATFREDIGKGRRPDAVKFSTIDKDVLRRDLTINALFYDIDRDEIVDLVGGIKDIENKNIRTVGDPLERFGEDALRKIRAIRFAARINGRIDKEVDNALIKDNSLPEVSAPRIHDEFKSGIEKAKKPDYYLSLVNQYDFWGSIFPDILVNKKFISSHNWKVQLAELLKPNNIDSISRKLREKLAYTEEETNAVEFMHFLLDFNIDTDLMEGLKKVKKKGVDIKDVVEFSKYNTVDLNMVKGLFRHEITTRGNSPELSGLKGKEIGNKIAELELEKFIKKWL
jgi:tRNA nucleotidyltransferase/poly(A) polymerase